MNAISVQHEVGPGGDEIGRLVIDGPQVHITVYLSPNDGRPVIEIDTQEGTGEIRVYVNDGQVFAGDPEYPPYDPEEVG